MLDKDHTGLPFSLNNKPERIVCLVPSITELLYDLGLGDQVHIIGGTKKIHEDKIRSLKPDLVIANKEENVKDQVVALSTFTNVFTTIVRDTKEALNMISDIGTITQTSEKAQSMINRFQSEEPETVQDEALSMVYLIWQEPYMTIGGDTFISAFMEEFGFINCFKNKNRYPQVDMAELKSMKPDIILLSSEPFPFADKHKKEILKETGINTQLIDGSICSWYGSRMLKAKDFFKTYKQQIMT